MFEDSASSSIPSSSIWGSMNSFFTPTVLFLLLNVMIATIAFTSALANQKPTQTNQPKITKTPSLLQRLKSTNFYSNYRSQQDQPQKPNPDSNTLFNFHETQILETQSLSPADYFFQENQNPQENIETLQSNTSYIFEQIHEQNIHLTQSQTHFVSDDFTQTHEAKIEEEEDVLHSMDEVYTKVTGGHHIRTKSDTVPASGEIPVKLPAKMRKSASSKSAFGHFVEKDIVEARRPATVREKGNAKVTEEDDEEVDAKADDFINKFKQQLKLQRLDSIIRYKDMIGRGSSGK